MAEPTPEDRDKAAAIVAAWTGSSFRSELIALIAQALASARAEWPEWIPCSERLPEPGVWVLAWMASNVNEVQMGQYGAGNGDFWWAFNQDDNPIDYVTHWLPLPQPPKVTP